MAETRKLVRDVMQKDWGQGEVVQPKKAKELILQVTISFWYNCLILVKIFFYLCISSSFSKFISIPILFPVFSGFT